MPQWLSNFWSGDNRTLQAFVVAAILLACLAVLYWLYRAIFGHRLRVPGGGRARQPRLGVVDAFAVDGQRQLVLVRRDNVEHLIMIGGPNDVVVESQIVRSGVPVAAPQREAAAKPAAAAPPSPALPPSPASPPNAPATSAPPAQIQVPPGIFPGGRPVPPPRPAGRPAG